MAAIRVGIKESREFFAMTVHRESFTENQSRTSPLQLMSP